MLKIFFLFLFIFVFMANSLFAREIYVKQNNFTREYVVVEKLENKGFNLKHYSQNKGEYQEIISSQKLSNRIDVKKKLAQSFYEFQRVNSLTEWEVEPQDYSNDSTLNLLSRSLFGKKHTTIWHARNKWDEEWEKKFSLWIQEEVQEDFYVKFNIATDCADAIVALRWIFARINSLPVANTLADTRLLFGNYSILKDWRKLPVAQNWYEDRLFLTALSYVMNLTSTRTIVYDGYPVSLDSAGFIPGVFIVTQNEGGGHVKFISETHPKDSDELPFYTLSSTEPKKVRSLNKEVMLDQDWPEPGIKDVLAFKWPEVVKGRWRLSDSLDRNNYSMDQYDSSLKINNPIFIEYILKNINGDYNPFKMIEIGANDLLRYLKHRVDIVNKGYEICKNKECAFDSVEDAAWGTRNRDEKILRKFRDLEILIREFSKINPYLNKHWISVLKASKIQVNNYELSLYVIKYIFEEKMHSSLASDTIQKRWGLDFTAKVKNWGFEVVKLLDQRNDIISNAPYACDETCIARDSKWLSLNTYHIDSELNKVAVKIRNFCHMFDEKLCSSILSTVEFDKSYDNHKRTLNEWIKNIPLLNSDPKTSRQARWGVLEDNIKARILPVHEKNAVIAKNLLALIDQEKLYDLENEVVLYNSKASEDLYLNESGVPLKVEKINSTYSVYIDGEWVNLETLNNIFEDYSKLKIIANGQSYILKYTRNDYVEIFTLREMELKSIGHTQNDFKVKGDYLYFSNSKNILEKELVFYNIKDASYSKINFKGISSLKNIELLEVDSFDKKSMILKYENKDEDRYLAFYVDFNDSIIQEIPNSVMGNYKVLWSNSALKKLVVKTQWNREFPKVFTISFKNSHWDNKELYNDAHSFQVINKDVYLISVQGGQWDIEPKARLFKWDERDISLIEDSNDKRPVIQTSIGYYFLTNFGGLFHDFTRDKMILAPGGMNFNVSNCSAETISSNQIIYRYNSSYGDYLCMGGVISSHSNLDRTHYISPVLTIYPWISEEELVDIHWLKNFKSSVAYDGMLISFGLNNSFWVDVGR